MARLPKAPRGFQQFRAWPPLNKEGGGAVGENGTAEERGRSHPRPTDPLGKSWRVCLGTDLDIGDRGRFCWPVLSPFVPLPIKPGYYTPK